jgi:aminoglycoside phosphotransferase
MDAQDFIIWAEKQLGTPVIASKAPHGDEGVVYRLETVRDIFFLKIASKLINERDRLLWLAGRLPVPQVIDFTHIKDNDALLLSAIEGSDLRTLAKIWEPNQVIDSLVDTLHRFHATDSKDCPFGSMGLNKVLVHGDACLSNFIFNGNSFSGYIDLGALRIDNPEVDLAAAVWSLQYNLGPGYGALFLRKYGIKEGTEELAERLKLQYEYYQKEQGFSLA